MYVMSPHGTGVTHVHVVMPDVTVLPDVTVMPVSPSPHDASSPHRSAPGGRETGPGTGRENAGVKESWGRA